MTSKPGRRLVGDANALLSAAARRAAARVLLAPDIEILAPREVMNDLIEHAPEFARRYGLTDEEILESVHALPLTLVDEELYAKELKEAERLIGARDPDDVPVLALALALKLPIWTNDDDFEGTGVSTFTTAVLLKVLGV